MTLQGTAYRDLQTSQYRVWCLEMLQARYRALEETTRARLDPVLQSTGVLEPLLRLPDVESRYANAAHAPFGKSLPVFAEIRN
jgi:hypothetical protein